MPCAHVLLVNNLPKAVVYGTESDAAKALDNLQTQHWRTWARRFGDGEQSRRVYKEQYRIWSATVPLVRFDKGN